MILNDFKKWAVQQHINTNHFYDTDLPYRFHLQMVANEVEYFREHAMELGTTLLYKDFMMAAWGHDLIEDTRTTYGDILKVTEEPVAEIIRAVTNYGRGKTRAERMPDFVYEDIRKTPGAAFIKLCDRIANVKYGVMVGSDVVAKYRAENEHFKKELYTKSLSGLFGKLDRLFAMIV